MEQRELIEKYVSNDDIYLYNTGNCLLYTSDAADE